MIAIDAGVMAHALNRYGPGHARASAVVESLLHGDQYWALPWPAVHTFLRLVTHPHRVARPLAPADAWGFVSLLLSSPGTRPIGPGSRHAEALTEILSLLPPGTVPVTGLELAAVLREHGVSEVLSTDRALRAFPFLSVRNPLKGEPWTPGAGPARRYRRLAPRAPIR